MPSPVGPAFFQIGVRGKTNKFPSKGIIRSKRGALVIDSNNKNIPLPWQPFDFKVNSAPGIFRVKSSVNLDIWQSSSFFGLPNDNVSAKMKFRYSFQEGKDFI